ncbi:adenine deaminase C-terminal domain-containing protein [Kyrpidia tusciae]|uniref:adenine deaminase n=1 Tax=Kyrpidia tusciae (strain DSM 2912 / NBRC 15312 / T2) TaxID=562970 RepID=D5WQT1_KYRT2|nr:adenine deaminase C-terminal domain-containing protein [Kyrpidia tusciae]ADG06690.1 Adenine deaminase [Kyrpidia tusciae DSM 2912]
MRIQKFEADRRELIEVARGDRPADLFIRGGTVVNVYSGELLPHHVAIYKDRIAYVGPRKVAVGDETQVVDAAGMFVVPGYIETHSHPWILYNPVSLAERIVPLGTTTVVHDTLFFYLHLGYKGTVELIEALRDLPINQLWLARMVAQAGYPEEGEWFNPAFVRKLLEHEDVIGTAELTRWPMLYQGDPLIVGTIEFAKELGKVSDGHTAGCSFEKLNVLSAGGLSACHEAITAREMLDRLRLGLWTVLRNSSLRPDLQELIEPVVEGQISTQRLLMTTDGPNPSFIEENGFLDGLLRQAVRMGVPPVTALQMVTLNAAQYLKLDDDIGGIAPGRRADVLILPDLENFRPARVVRAGREVARDGRLIAPIPDIAWDLYPSMKPLSVAPELLADPNLYRLEAKDGEKVPVIEFISNVITRRTDAALSTDGEYVAIGDRPDLAYAALVARDGTWVAKGVIRGFGGRIGGLASTYNTTTELLVIGRDSGAMAVAAERVRQMGGGIALAEDGEVKLDIPLPLYGIMSDRPFARVVRDHDRLLAAVQKRGFPFHDILYSLLFLTCDFLPGLRLTPLGLYDVKRAQVVRKRRNLPVRS